ncbi:hypothetical protein Pmani_009441 [Petrolisthes manimaculis]|uniref:Uncharacterized protein n=1 Tax=Petrolisthes manimaculis TaxID=1843537 RepID=A0AAE1Q3I8_9EUCA|nr:hypothetical protein Pmani_009441 [Petrolisthes manimaculis]
MFICDTNLPNRSTLEQLEGEVFPGVGVGSRGGEGQRAALTPGAPVVNERAGSRYPRRQIMSRSFSFCMQQVAVLRVTTDVVRLL